MLTKEDLQAMRELIQPLADGLKEIKDEMHMDRIGNAGEHDYLNRELEKINDKLELTA